MKKINRMFPAMILILVLLISCNLPFRKEPITPNVTPNMTLTALFDTSMNIPPTLTPDVPASQPTLLPTSTVITNTPIPTFTPATNIVVPTNTSPAPVNATATPQVRERGGTLMKAAYLSTPPVLDGTYAEWVDKTNKYAIPHVVYQPQNWANMADLEGAFASAWDDKYLYVSVKVTDDIFSQTRSGETLYLGDSVEILIDANLAGDFFVASLDKDDYQIGISPGNPDKEIAPEVFFWYPSGSRGSKNQVAVASLFETNPIYRVEVAIPWSLLGVTPEKGLHLGFAVSVSDNDKTGENLQQTMISTAKNRDFLDPTTWGELVLEK